MKTFTVFLVLVLTAIQCGAAEELPGKQYRCGLGDPKFGVCVLAADFFVEHKAWPLTRAAIEAHFVRVAARERVTGEEAKPEEFFRQFIRLELRKKGAALVIRLRVDKEESDTVITLKPGANLEEIVQSATDEKA